MGTTDVRAAARNHDSILFCSSLLRAIKTSVPRLIFSLRQLRFSPSVKKSTQTFSKIFLRFFLFLASYRVKEEFWISHIDRR
jgi:hypothetical protein